jgi:predicted PurR-regulated permease PerM
MWLLAKRTAVVLATALVFAAAAAFVYASRWVFIAFLFAIFFADLLQPVVEQIQSWTKISRGSRAIAILEVYAIGAILIVVAGLVVGPRIGDEIRRLGAALPGLLDKVNSGSIVRQVAANRGWNYETQIRLEDVLLRHRDVVLSLEGKLGMYIAAFAQNLVWFVVIPILAIFFLKDGPAFVDALVKMAARRNSQRLLRTVFEDLNEMVTHYVRTQLVLAGLALIVYTFVFWVMRLPYSFALSSIAGVLEFIPVVGPAVAAVVVLGVAFLAGYNHLVIVIIFLGCWRIVQDYFISPQLMKSNLEMHPLAVIFAVLVGAELGGVVGVYLSIPVMASLRIVWRSWQRYSEMRQQAQPRAA